MSDCRIEEFGSCSSGSTASPRANATGVIDAAVRQVIGTAVCGRVIDLFAVAGLDAARLDILSDEFLERVSALEQKNLALETLRKLLNDQIKISERTNLVQAQKFREELEKAMLGYTNKQISTAQMIAKLLELAKWVRDAKRHGHELGLNDEETAFYDALAENGSAKEVMKSDQLRLMARELAEMVKKMPKLIENNRWFHEVLTSGVPVEYKEGTIGETGGGRARLIDFDTPANNDFLVVRQPRLRVGRGAGSGGSAAGCRCHGSVRT